MHINELFDNVIITINPTIVVSTLLAAMITWNYIFIIFFMVLILFGTLTTFVERSIFKKLKFQGIRPNKGCMPQGSGICLSCHDFGECNKKSTTWGMPSGHTQLIFTTATFGSLCILNIFKNQFTNQRKIITISLFFLIAIIVALQRGFSKCHNIYQILAGVGFGILWGVVAFAICFTLFPQKFNPEKLENNGHKGHRGHRGWESDWGVLFGTTGGIILVITLAIAIGLNVKNKK